MSEFMFALGLLGLIPATAATLYALYFALGAAFDLGNRLALNG